jgi:hypothetical protein
VASVGRLVVGGELQQSGELRIVSSVTRRPTLMACLYGGSVPVEGKQCVVNKLITFY